MAWAMEAPIQMGPLDLLLEPIVVIVGCGWLNSCTSRFNVCLGMRMLW